MLREKAATVPFLSNLQAKFRRWARRRRRSVPADAAAAVAQELADALGLSPEAVQATIQRTPVRGSPEATLAGLLEGINAMQRERNTLGRDGVQTAVDAGSGDSQTVVSTAQQPADRAPPRRNTVALVHALPLRRRDYRVRDPGDIETASNPRGVTAAYYGQDTRARCDAKAALSRYLSAFIRANSQHNPAHFLEYIDVRIPLTADMLPLPELPGPANPDIRDALLNGLYTLCRDLLVAAGHAVPDEFLDSRLGETHHVQQSEALRRLDIPETTGGQN